jgi:hypothetical protein
MNSKKLAVLLALAPTVVLGLIMFGASNASALATNRSVAPGGSDTGDCSGSPCLTIQYAISQSVAGDTINVAAGTYNEQVQINKTLTLKGAQAGVDARTRIPTNESIIDNACGPVQIMADNVVLDGFTVQGSTLSDPCFLSGIWTNPGYSGTQGGHQILNNIVQNNISGIELDSTCVNPTLVQFNLIQNNSNPGPGSGNGIQTNFGLCNATIDKNKFSGDTSSSVLINAGPGGGNNLAVTNNELVAGTPERIVFVGVTNSAINFNTSIGSTALNGPIRFAGTNSNITINSNVLRNGVRGIKVDGTNTNITAHLNCIEGNTVAGLDVTAGAYSGTLNAENNWWGSASGPTIASNPGGTGDAIIDPSGVVDYTPFLTSSAGTPCAPPPVGPPTNKDQCKNGGWQTFNTPRTFKNQGDCIQYVNTGK